MVFYEEGKHENSQEITKRYLNSSRLEAFTLFFSRVVSSIITVFVLSVSSISGNNL